jgi:HSP20 family protein
VFADDRWHGFCIRSARDSRVQENTRKEVKQVLPVLFTNRWNDLFPSVEGLLHRVSESVGRPMPLDIQEQEGGWLIEVELPGAVKDDVSIQVEHGVLTISAEYGKGSDERKDKYHVRERRFGRMSRSVVLPESADSAKIEAKLAHGLLTLTIPVREEARPRRVEVK